MRFAPRLLTTTLQSSTRSSFLQVLKTAIAAIIAWLLSSLLLGQALPIFAAIAALLVVQPSVNQSLAKGVERSVGVIAGVVLAFGVGFLFGTSSWIVLSAIVVALLVAWAFKLGPGSANQIPISAMLVLAIGGLTPLYAFDRIVETIIGAAVGLAVNAAIVPPVLLAPGHLAVARLLRAVATAIDTLADALSTARTRAELDTMLQSVRALRGLQDAAITAVARGEESLTLNPRRSRHRSLLRQDTELLARLSVVVTRIIGMTRAVHDRYDDDLVSEPSVAAIATELHRAAHDLRLLGGSDGNSSTDGNGNTGAVFVTEPEPLALTAPLTIPRPHPDHWILIGSLLEDLRRVREEIVGSDES